MDQNQKKIIRNILKKNCKDKKTEYYINLNYIQVIKNYKLKNLQSFYFW